MGWESSVKIETNEASKKIDTHCCAIKAMIFGKLETVRHILREVSRHVFLLIGEEGGRIDDLCCKHAAVTRPSLVVDSK